MDWNNDGMKDLLLGDTYGNVRVYLNVGRDDSPVFNSPSFVKVGGSVFDVGSYSKPSVADWNNDGKKDLLCGSYDGLIRLLINTGTDAVPSFAGSRLIQNSGAVLDAGSWSMPLAVDWDMDGSKDLLVGNDMGDVHFYRNQGADDSPVFSGFSKLTAGGAVLDEDDSGMIGRHAELL